jgi:nucleoside-diphosphate-sugar epimerase
VGAIVKPQPLLITGGCGFVGRHVVQYALHHSLYERIWLVDDLFTGRHPEEWLPPQAQCEGSYGRVYSYRVNGTSIRFIHDDVRHFFSDSLKD